MEITIEELDEYKQKIQNEMDVLFYYKVKKMVDNGYTEYGILHMLTHYNTITGKKRDELHPIMDNVLDNSKPIMRRNAGDVNG